jgi:hypothetical protein
MYVCNTPPDHAKTHTISISYAVWRIVKNPNIRILIISKTQDLAKDILTAIKDRLDSRVPMFEELKRDFGPVEGYEANSAEWRQDRIRLNTDLLTSGEKDPTVQAKGIGQQIYGKRADLIIMDDCIDGTNVHEFEKQIRWTHKEVQSRLVDGGTLLIIGTRMASQDFYREIMQGHRYPRGVAPYTLLTQPAVLELDEDPNEWVTLWPKSNNPPDMADQFEFAPEKDEDGLYTRFDGPYMQELKDSMTPTEWAMVYMQQQVDENSTFTLDMINGCTDELRIPGVMVAGQRGHRADGMSGLFVIAGLDPAPSNYTAAVVVGVDRSTGRRYLLDVWNQHGAQPSQIRALIKAWTVRYNVMEWRIEENGLNNYISQDEEILRWCRSRGVGVFGHLTNRNKWDPQFGVATMANLFMGYENGGNMIQLPARRNHPGVQALVEQLITWYPTPSMTKMPTQDCVMALWFVELRARTITDEYDHTTHMESDMMSEFDRENQVTVDMDDWLARSHGGGDYMMLDDWFEKNKQEMDMGRWGRGGY